jgi:hypothetical protein
VVRGDRHERIALGRAQVEHAPTAETPCDQARNLGQPSGTFSEDSGGEFGG